MTTQAQLEYRDADLFVAHGARYGGHDAPGVAQLQEVWQGNAHDRIEPGLRVQGDRVFAGRYSSYYTDRADVAVRAFARYRKLVEAAYPGAKLDVSLVQQFLSLGVPREFTRNAAVGLDARPTLAKSRIKVGFGGRIPFPERIARAMLPFSTVSDVTSIEPLLDRLWVLNFDVGLGGVSEAKLYFGFEHGEYDHPLLRELLGEFADHHDSSMCFLQYARGDWAFHYTADADRVAARVAPSPAVDLGSRDVFSVGARTSDLRSGRPLRDYNLYAFYRPGERPPAPAGTRPVTEVQA